MCHNCGGHQIEHGRTPEDFKRSLGAMFVEHFDHTMFENHFSVPYTITSLDWFMKTMLQRQYWGNAIYVKMMRGLEYEKK
jgi:hypothetical protein